MAFVLTYFLVDFTLDIGFLADFVYIATNSLQWVVEVLSAVLFFKVLGFPFMVLWLAIGGIFFTLRLSFVNLRLFGHGIKVVMGKYSSKKDPGEISHFQALVTAVSGTVGLGNIAGVAIAVSLGGPGAVIWMMLAGFLGMSAKFAEVTLGLKYRKIDKDGKVSGGAFHYLQNGLKDIKMPGLGKVLACIFAVFCMIGSFGIGNMFQSNQTVKILTDTFGVFNGMGWLLSAVIAVTVGIALIGGIKRIALYAEAIVPFMALLYIVACFVVIGFNFDKLGSAVAFMFYDAFNMDAVDGGIIGAIVNGFKRAVFSNEAGLGSAPIAHAAAKTKEPVREGVVALLEPFIDTIVICFMTGLVITITGVYQGNTDGSISGVLLTAKAFETAFVWFPMVLSVCVALYAYSTMITWSYYGETAWRYLFGTKHVVIFQLAFCFAVFIGGIVDDIKLIVDFADLLVLTMAIPNMIGMYLLSGMVRRELDAYTKKLKAGKFG